MEALFIKGELAAKNRLFFLLANIKVISATNPTKKTASKNIDFSQSYDPLKLSKISGHFAL